MNDDDAVAPPAGAWIETRYMCWAMTGRACRAPRGRVDRNMTGDDDNDDTGVAPPAGAWIETK